MLRSGEFKHAELLQPNESLMPFSEVLNHKVVRVEKLDIIEDAYDLVIEDAYNKNGGPEHCFALSCGIFVHNTDIKWIVDVEELRNQLSCALRVPLQALGGYIDEGTGALGASSLAQLDMRFARTSRRLQRSVTNAIRKLCQVHLAYLGYDPDPRLFEVHMTETSTAEEKEVQESLDASLDVVSKFIELLSGFIPEDKLNKLALIDYFNSKLLKLDDFNLEEFLKLTEGIQSDAKVTGKDLVKLSEAMGFIRKNLNTMRSAFPKQAYDEDPDLRSYLPVNEAVKANWEKDKGLWESKTKAVKITAKLDEVKE